MNEIQQPTARRIPDRLDNPLRSALFSWQTLLLLVAVGRVIAHKQAAA